MIGRAAEAYAHGDVTDLMQKAELIYPGGKLPFQISDAFPCPLHLFSPRLTAMLQEGGKSSEAPELWRIITARENIIRMTSATELGRTAAEALGSQFADMYDGVADRDAIIRRKQMIGYMIKIVMECFGYIVRNNRMQIDTFREGADRSKRRTNFFSTATRYERLTSDARNALKEQIADSKAADRFQEITDLILTGRTKYQIAYEIDRLSSWDTL